MLKLGKLQDSKKQKKTYTFNELVRDEELLAQFKEEAKIGLGILSIILLPSKYPSGALIFDFSSFRLKKTLKGDEIINWLRAEGFDKRYGKDKVQYRLKLTEDGELLVYELPIAFGGYIKTDYGFKFFGKEEDWRF